MKNQRATTSETAPPKSGAPRAAERRARTMRKRRDAAAVLTILGVVLFASPLVSAIGSADGGGTVPLAVQYVFDVWAMLIAGAFIMARLLPRSEDASASDGADHVVHTAPSVDTLRT